MGYRGYLPPDKRNAGYNMELIEEYPFLMPRNRWTDEPLDDYDYLYTELDAMPEGWRKAFGDLLLADLKDALIRGNVLNEYRIDQIKEKFGELRWYASQFTEESEQIVDSYSALSQNICIECGRPDVHMTYSSWISPFCEDCWNADLSKRAEENCDCNSCLSLEEEKVKLITAFPYSSVIHTDESGKMANSRSEIHFSKEGTVTYEYGLSEIAQRIRDNWSRNYKK